MSHNSVWLSAVEQPGMPLGSMLWQVRSPLIDDRRRRNTETRGKPDMLDPLLDNACSDYNSIGSCPFGCVGMVRRGEDIETKWISGRSTTPIRAKRNKKSNVGLRATRKNKTKKSQSPFRGRGIVVITGIPRGRAPNPSSSCPVRHPNLPNVWWTSQSFRPRHPCKTAQRQRLHLTCGPIHSSVSTAARHSGAPVFCQRIVSTLCHVAAMFGLGTPLFTICNH